MPSQILHVLTGERAALQAGMPAGIVDSPEFRLGCQGPDLFAHNRRTRPFALAYARLLHRRDYGVFCGAFYDRLLKGSPDFVPAGLPWYVGFLTHQISDRIFHPYIVYRSSGVQERRTRKVNPARYHAFFERIIDVCVLQAIAGARLSSFDTGHAFSPGEDSLRLLVPEISEALSCAYPREADGDEQLSLRVRNAFDDAVHFYSVTNPAVLAVRTRNSIETVERYASLGLEGAALLHPDELDSSIDWANIAHTQWMHPVSGAVHTESVEDLFGLAVESASKLLCAVFGPETGMLFSNKGSPGLSLSLAVSTPAEIASLVGNECLGVCGDDGLTGIVKWVDPFPLEDELFRQAEKRRTWLSAVRLTPDTGIGMMDLT
ncbi:MAG TPA: hypothetical protein PL077_03560 [Treponemataceae bacterium]|nr:hypothetical protein [Treponemataceae bacterium]